MAKKIIHVNKHNIRFNAKNPNILKPVITVKEGKKNTYAMSVKINGPSELIYRKDKPLSCGARVWIETYADIELENPMTFAETKALECKAKC